MLISGQVLCSMVVHLVGEENMCLFCADRRWASGSFCIHSPSLYPPLRSSSGQCQHSATHEHSLCIQSGSIHTTLWSHLDREEKRVHVSKVQLSITDQAHHRPRPSDLTVELFKHQFIFVEFSMLSKTPILNTLFTPLILFHCFI